MVEFLSHQQGDRIIVEYHFDETELNRTALNIDNATESTLCNSGGLRHPD